MERSAIVRDKETAAFASVTQCSYSTEERLPPQLGAPSSWLGRGRKRRALIWGITSTVLSAIGLIGLAMFEQYNGMLSELRSDLKHFNEISGEFVKKDRMQRCWDRMREYSREVAAASMAREQTERELQASERAREEMTKEMQQLRERLAYLEGLRAARLGVVSTVPAERSGRDEEVRRKPADPSLSKAH
ncbi:MAG TPA: hypothetical protein VG013_33630 [Gemmataceae bacterium]|jgi:septal ring factor EnvC (AmiA/AmiB activator)|nr:hypothetical protein [Gemmataceae bacterium]